MSQIYKKKKKGDFTITMVNEMFYFFIGYLLGYVTLMLIGIAYYLGWKFAKDVKEEQGIT